MHNLGKQYRPEWVGNYPKVLIHGFCWGALFKVTCLVIAKFLPISRDLCPEGSMDVFRRWSTILLEIIVADADLVNTARFRDIGEMYQGPGGIGRGLIL